MLAELVKVLEEKKAALEGELRGKHAAPEAGELERKISLINEQTIKGYKVLWRTFAPPNPFPCPFCFVFHKKVSPLKPQSLVGDTEPFNCPECKETFQIPVELF